MIDYIICDDNQQILKDVDEVVNKVMMPMAHNYRVHKFDKNSDTLQNMIKQNGTKIYIIDIELPGISGIEIAREIRTTDWNSIIIILSAHNELSYDIFKNRLTILDFVSKFDNYKTELTEILKYALEGIGRTKSLRFSKDNVIYQIPFKDILYIEKDGGNRNATITTDTEEIMLNKTITSIRDLLDDSFVQTHRSCIVNLLRIKKIDFAESEILFDNGRTISYLSKNYKKELKKYV